MSYSRSFIAAMSFLLDMAVSGQVSGCMVTQDVNIGGYRLSAQKVVAARELRGPIATPAYALRYVRSQPLMSSSVSLSL